MELKQEQRTNQQNKGLHKWCSQIADEYNRQGLTVQQVIKKFKMEVMFTPENVKEILIRTAIKALYNKTSTTKLLTTEIDKLVDVITKFNGQIGIEYIPFPSEENKKYEETKTTIR